MRATRLKAHVSAVISATIIAALMTAVVGLSATGASAASPRAELKKAVTAYSKAFFAGDGAKAISYLAKRCKTAIMKAELDEASDDAHVYVGNQRLKTFRITSFKGNRAKVTYTFAARMYNVKNEGWIREKGRWRNNAC